MVLTEIVEFALHAQDRVTGFAVGIDGRNGYTMRSGWIRAGCYFFVVSFQQKRIPCSPGTQADQAQPLLRPSDLVQSDILRVASTRKPYYPSAPSLLHPGSRRQCETQIALDSQAQLFSQFYDMIKLPAQYRQDGIPRQAYS